MNLTMPAFAVLVSFLIGCPSAGAYEVVPLKIAFDTSSSEKSISRLTISNTDSFDIALEIDVLAIDVTSKVSTDDIVVFPPLAAVKSGASQSFQVRYVGEPPNTVMNYHVVVRQLPVDFTKSDGTTIKVGVNFVVLVRVGPDASFNP